MQFESGSVFEFESGSKIWSKKRYVILVTSRANRKRRRLLCRRWLVSGGWCLPRAYTSPSPKSGRREPNEENECFRKGAKTVVMNQGVKKPMIAQEKNLKLGALFCNEKRERCSKISRVAKETNKRRAELLGKSFRRI